MPPPSLGIAGREKWHAICQTLIDRKMMSRHWLTHVEHLCKQYDLIAVYNTRILADGGLTLKNSHGNVVVHPLTAERTKVATLIRHMLNDLGLSPSSARLANVPVVREVSSPRLASRPRDDDPFSIDEP